MEAENQKNRESSQGGSAEACAIEPGSVPCDACGTAMKPMGHCKYWCLSCGFLRTCNDVI